MIFCPSVETEAQDARSATMTLSVLRANERLVGQKDVDFDERIQQTTPD
jgi:hypothetical protein